MSKKKSFEAGQSSVTQGSKSERRCEDGSPKSKERQSQTLLYPEQKAEKPGLDEKQSWDSANGNREKTFEEFLKAIQSPIRDPKNGLDDQHTNNCAKKAEFSKFDAGQLTESLKFQRDFLTWELEDAETKLKHVKEQNAKLKEDLADKECEAEHLALELARQSAQLHAGGDRGSSTVREGHSAEKKSYKLPDPDRLNDGKTGPSFDEWELAMKLKLKANADHLDNPDIRMAYVASRCEGMALQYLSPRLREESTNPFRDADDIFRHLELAYGDPMKEFKARLQYELLLMRPDQGYGEFLVEFMRLAQDAGINPVEYQRGLCSKLNDAMQAHVKENFKACTTFETFNEKCHEAAFLLEMEQASKSHISPGARTKTTAGATSRGASTSSQTTARWHPFVKPSDGAKRGSTAESHLRNVSGFIFDPEKGRWVNENSSTKHAASACHLPKANDFIFDREKGRGTNEDSSTKHTAWDRHLPKGNHFIFDREKGRWTNENSSTKYAAWDRPAQQSADMSHPEIKPWSATTKLETHKAPMSRAGLHPWLNRSMRV